MSDDNETSSSQPKWQTLGRIERRVLGVLVEKAKTTPDNYPLSRNALVNGCNQKSNRFPQMQLDEEHVDDALENLRRLGAVALIQGDGRVEKFRHLAYDWLGVDKAELAVMAELLLRGAQTIGELRARAARMEKIPSLGDLQPIVDSLRQKQLLLLLTPPGRGCVLTHALYQDQELAKLRAEHGPTPVDQEPDACTTRPSPIDDSPQRIATTSVPTAGAQPQADQLAGLRLELSTVREDLTSQIDALRSELNDLKRQLGV